MKSLRLRKVLVASVGPLIILVGLGFRTLRAWNEVFWNDEVFYFEVSHFNNVKTLLSTDHWIVDHPPIYLLLEHFLTKVATSPFVLRIPSLVAYLVSSYFVWEIAEKILKKNSWRYLTLAYYAFFPYFVGLEWQAIPYAWAMCFFVISYWSLLKLIDGDSDYWLKATFVASSLLFLLTSYEAVYYMVSLLVSLMVLKMANMRAEVGVASKLLVLTGILFMPQVWVVWRNLDDFAGLAGHIEEWHWGLANLRVEVLAIPWSVLAGILLLLAVKLVNLRKKKLGDSVLLANMLIIVISLLMIFGVSKLFYYVSHPKAYYYLLLVGWWTVVKILEEVISNKKIKFVVIMGVAFWVLGICRGTSDWMETNYLYSRVPSNFVEVRDIVLEMTNSDAELVVVTDRDILLGNWRNSYSLDRYYMNCYDKSDVAVCESLKRARDALNYEENSSRSRVIGVFTEKQNYRYFERNIAPKYRGSRMVKLYQD